MFTGGQDQREKHWTSFIICVQSCNITLCESIAAYLKHIQ